MFAVGTDHWLAGVERKPTPNLGHQFSQGNPSAIIVHYTAGLSAAGSLRVLTEPASQVSAHILISRDGTVYQLAPFDRITWHAGISSYLDARNFNSRSIGIELDNAGALQGAPDGRYKSWSGATIEKDQVVIAKHRNNPALMGWHKYTEKQLSACTQVCRALVARYGMRNIFGHDEVAPDRKIDPGPAYPIATLRREILGHQNPLARVTATSLNIRQQPHVGAPLADAPLPNQQQVEVVKIDGEWVKVRRSLEGWVAGKYLGL